MGSAAECSEDPTSERNVDGWREQYDSAVRIGNAQDEDLGAYRTDLSRRKVEDRDDQLAAQILRAVMHRQLSATAPGDGALPPGGSARQAGHRGPQLSGATD